MRAMTSRPENNLFEWRHQLQVHEPEELIFVEQTPMTMGGPGDLTQTALPALDGSTPSEVPGSMAGARLVLS